ncbi:MAG TPA: TadE family protein, partial [Anaerolineales bacterium]|nr:TadE family protein [Anaerolineales bacterium]
MRRENGQSLAEFGLLLPVFLLAVMMIVDIGRAVYYYSVIYNAAREGARRGVIDMSLTTDDPDVEAAVKRLAGGLLDGVNNDSDIETYIKNYLVNVVGPSGQDYDAIEVSVAYKFKAATPFLARL